MRVIFPLALSTLCVTGCGSDGNNDGGTTDTGPTYTVPELTFKGAVNAKSIDGNLSENTVLGHKAAYMYAGSLALAAADEGVQERLAGHGSDARDSHCWIAPVVPLSNFTLDYSPCTDAGLGISGGMIFNEDPLGPVSLAFQSMTFDTSRTLSGAVGLDHDDNAAPLAWATYDTNADTPTRDNRVPLQITVDGRDLSVSVDGGVSLSNFLGEWRSWGVMDVTPYGGSAVRVSMGSGSEAELMTSSLPDEPLSSSLSYLACRCPVSGVVSMNLEMQVAEIKFDLDNLIEEEDEIDDPDVSIDVSLVVDGPGEVRPTECGVHEGVWSPAEEPVVTVDSDDLSTAIQNLCDAALITEPGRCTALLQAAATVGSVDVSVGENKLQNAIGTSVAVELDNSFCHLN